MRLTKSNVFLFLLGILMLGQIFQYFTRVTHIPTFWPAFAGIILYTTFVNPQVYIRPSVLSVLLLYIILLLYDAADHLNNVPPAILSPFGIFSFVFPYFVSALVLENLLILYRENPHLIYNLGKLSYIIILITIIVSLISEIAFPGITRSVGRIEYSYFAWSMSFGTFYATPFVLMTILIYYKKSSIRLIFITLLFLIMIVYAGFLTALALALATSIIGILYRLRVKNKLFVLGIILASSLFLISNVYTIVAFFPSLPNPIYLQKVNEITQIMESSNITEAVTGTRVGVYDASIQTIQENLVFGSGDYDLIGQHSFWLDKFGFLGVLGVLLYLLVLFNLFKSAREILFKSQRMNYTTLFVIICLYLFLNPVEWPDFWLIVFVMIPSIIVYLSYSGNLYKKRTAKVF